MAFELGDIPEGKERGWSVFIDGVEYRPKKVQISNPRFGTITYGLWPQGYDGWCFHELGGGGSVTLPYSYTPDGELLVGLLLEKRANMGGDVWCVIGGFIDPGETHDKAQAREAVEESGLDTVSAVRLPGVPTNPDRGFFITDGVDEGVHAYGLEVPFNMLETDGGSSFKLKGAAPFTGYKKADGVRFFLWREAINCTPDGLARVAIAQLLAMVL